jgi:nucleotidyltransferase substrate binding protein (TIGR01987 family)
MNNLTQIRQLLLPLAKFQNLRAVKLFGSRVRGDNKSSSDYDFAVFLKDKSNNNWADIEEAVKSCVNLPADVVDYNNASKAIKEQIDAQGEIVFFGEKWYVSLVRLGKAVASLADIIDDEDDAKHKHRDSVLSRFEYIFEYSWKTLGRLLLAEGFDEKSPRDIIVRANQMGWIDGDLWLDMLKKRNELSHIYDEELAEEAFEFVVKNFPKMLRTYQNLWAKFGQNPKI